MRCIWGAYACHYRDKYTSRRHMATLDGSSSQLGRPLPDDEMAFTQQAMRWVYTQRRTNIFLPRQIKLRSKNVDHSFFKYLLPVITFSFL
jgi:hypothetical protein